jgi:CDP-diacylglycerol--glycerol-3-phosphate 3-phosphatidyltransferase
MPGLLRHLPNALSIARIVAAPVLVALAAAGNETAFTWVLVPALLSDIADGLIARLLHLQSRLGALLDSVADVLLLFTALYAVRVFHPEIVAAHWPAGALLVGVWLAQNVTALLRYGRLSSFHTLLSKVAGYLLGIFVGVLFVFGFQPWLLYLAVGVSVIGNLEEFALMALLPSWRPDVRGLWWLLREQRAGRPS